MGDAGALDFIADICKGIIYIYIYASNNMIVAAAQCLIFMDKTDVQLKYDSYIEQTMYVLLKIQ